MTSPMLTVLILAVLWLIVVVPMIVRRKDARAGERSVARFSSAMRALAARRGDPPVIADAAESRADEPHARADVAPSAVGASPVAGGPADPVVHRRPVPVAKESLMYPPDRSEMSDARRRMMTRRRRSLMSLGAGSLVMFVIALMTGASTAWLIEIVLLVAVGGYVAFLRSQARRDRERREARRERALLRSASTGYDATAAPVAPVVRSVANAVRIDEDDVELDHLDTVDLTGLYSDAEFDDVPIRKAG